MIKQFVSYIITVSVKNDKITAAAAVILSFLILYIVINKSSFGNYIKSGQPFKKQKAAYREI